ncbi:MAG: AMP-binding protein, partial [Deltaproteobacteria bacterium]|nr:AMP-binding protein [Deltaproteobacteria bacterium]
MTRFTNMTDYDQEYADFKWDVPEYFNFTRDVFDKWAEDEKKLALWWIDDHGKELKITYNELKARSSRLANALSSNGVAKGDIVMLVMPRLVAWWETNLACIRLGAVVSPGTTMLTAHDLEYRLELSDAGCIVCDSEMAQKVDEVKDKFPKLKTLIVVDDTREGWLNYEDCIQNASSEFAVAQTHHDDSCILYFTSGTTGMPKMTLHTQASYPYGHMVTGKYWHDLGPDDLDWTLTDTGWAKAAYGMFFATWYQGATVFVQHTSGFDSKTILDILNKYPITVFCAPPTAYRMFIQEDLSKFSLGVVRRCVSAGEPLNPEVIQIWQKAFDLPIYEGYGQTETVLMVGTFASMEVKPGAMGKPTPGFYMAVLDENQNELPPGKEGDLAVRVKPERPVGLFKAYWKAPEKTAEVFRGDWYLTGDRAMTDEDGYFWFVGRSDDVILSSGYRIGPFEVE